MIEMNLAALERAAALVHRVIRPTPQYSWPLLNARAGCELWVKHENHTPIGAFKVRGGLVLLDSLKSRPGFRGVISATRGNHGQSLAFAAARAGARCVILVPHGNSREKNAAMRALGAQLVEHGRDFDEARERASALAAGEGLEFVGPFRPELVAGVASYALELFRGAPPLDAVYVPIGCGSGICGLIHARDALGLATRIIGVVSASANAYARSFGARSAIETASAVTIADGMAVRVPVPAALEVIFRGAERIVEVTDAGIAAAMRHFFTDTHNVAEGAGAAPLAAALQERERWHGARVGVILSGGNVDREIFARVLADPPARPPVE
ncbi:MAG: threonine dehydratase [Burkholderiales bacterium]|nr:threonine dehydratase [Burkholderiales bacterium]